MSNALSPSKKSAQAQRCIDLARSVDVLSSALSDVVNLGAKWFGHSRSFGIGVTRPKSASGGIAIIRQGGMVSAYYFEEYVRAELEHIASVLTHGDTEYNRELLCRREAIQAARYYVTEQQKSL